MNPKSTPLLPWFEALKFSLRVMRKSFFKLFLPSMALSFLMGAFHALLGFVLFVGHNIGDIIHLKMIAFFLLNGFLAIPIYSFIYPLLKRYVIFQGLQELNPFPFNEYKLLSRRFRYRFFLRLIKISLKRYSFQTIAFLVLLLPPIINLMFNQSGLDIIILFSLVSLWPLAMSYFDYFFAELGTIDEMSHELRSNSNQSVSPTLPHKKLFWPILSWKTLLFVAYITLLFVLSLTWNFIATFTDRQSGVMGNGNLFREFLSYFADGLSESLSPLLTINLLLVSFPSVWFNISGSNQPYTFWVQLFFILLFGLLTAFFFLVETLSSVYFYHSAQRKMENSSLSGVDIEEA